tara:strand:- start:16 stop:408 length:393 start_codon:yes stop_codon:yes gene_type:complete
VKQVQKEHSEKLIALRLKENQNPSQYTLVEPLDPYRLSTFILLQVADVYYTYEGLKYDCVIEVNPLIGDHPSLDKMLITKTAVLIPAFNYDYQRGNLNNRAFDSMNSLMALIIANNINVVQKAKKYCQLR